jgi:hypothetical protein
MNRRHWLGIIGSRTSWSVSAREHRPVSSNQQAADAQHVSLWPKATMHDFGVDTGEKTRIDSEHHNDCRQAALAPDGTLVKR